MNIQRFNNRAGLMNPEDGGLYVRYEDHIATQPPQDERGPGWKLVPVKPTTAMISAMACSQARDDEGQFPSLLDLIDYSGENKTHTVLKAAYQSMLDATPAHEPATPPQPVAAEVEKDTQRLDWLERQGYSYGFEDMHEGNRWMIEGPFRTIRIAIDAAMAGTGSDDSGEGEA